MRFVGNAYFVGFGVFFLAAATVSAAACDGGSDTAGTSTSSGTGGTGGAPPPEPFSPQGCMFQVAARPEYLEWSESKPETAATPNIRRVRLGLGGNTKPGEPGKVDPATSIGIGWQTDDGTLASEVRWGSSPDASTWPAENRTTGVTWLTPEGTINANGNQRMHEVYVCGLTPETTYYYQVGGGPSGSEVWSDVYHFTTTPNNPNTPVSIVLAGDSRGQDNEAWRVLQDRATKLGATLQLFSGDMINFAPDQGEWEKWLDLAWKDSEGNLSTLGQLLTVHTHGNHENHTSLFYGNMLLPQDIANYPNYAELFYSFDVGPVHVVVVDDYWVGFPEGDPAYKSTLTAWLDADLTAANANRSVVPWIITMHHHGELSSSSHGTDSEVLAGREYFMPIWDKYHVDLAVAGHDHNYERSKPVTGPAASPTPVNLNEGTVYLVCAGVGADAYGSGMSSFTDVSHNFSSGEFIGFYSILSATKTSLTIDGYELHIDGADVKFDTLTLTK